MELLQGGLKLRQLQVFREVLRTGSTRRAATAVGISQPAVSQHVKQLEAALGFTFFQKIGQSYPSVAPDCRSLCFGGQGWSP